MVAYKSSREQGSDGARTPLVPARGRQRYVDLRVEVSVIESKFQDTQARATQSNLSEKNKNQPIKQKHWKEKKSIYVRYKVVPGMKP